MSTRGEYGGREGERERERERERGGGGGGGGEERGGREREREGGSLKSFITTAKLTARCVKETPKHCAKKFNIIALTFLA